MDALSRAARFILDRMEPHRCYEVSELRAFVPDVSAETLREVMHQLWINRQVERVGDTGWQRYQSAAAHPRPVDGQLGGRDAPGSGVRQTKVVKPDDLFDHGSFTDFFR